MYILIGVPILLQWLGALVIIKPILIIDQMTLDAGGAVCLLCIILITCSVALF